MCEIAVVPAPSSPLGVTRIVSLAEVLYEDNPHGLGVLAVATDGDRFRFRRYKAEEPDFEVALPRFLEATREDAWRYIVHARLATAGGIGFEQAHPIGVCDCPACDVRYVVHNGRVDGYEEQMTELEADGHEFSTAVDTEVIAHSHASVPDSIEPGSGWTPPDLRGDLNYYVCSEDGILVRNTGKYAVSDRFTVACCARETWSVEGESSQEFVLLRPDKSFTRRSDFDRGTSSIPSSG